MKQKIQAKKGSFYIYIICSLILPIYICFFVIDQIADFWFILPAFLPFLLFIWIYFSTIYHLDNRFFYYQSAFLKGKIEIDKITEVQTNKTLWSGVKPALATKGIIIKFGYDEIYVAPIHNQELIQALLKVNPNIIVK